MFSRSIVVIQYSLIIEFKTCVVRSQVKAEEERARAELERVRAEHRAAQERHALFLEELKRLNGLESSADPQCDHMCSLNCEELLVH